MKKLMTMFAILFIVFILLVGCSSTTKRIPVKTESKVMITDIKYDRNTKIMSFTISNQSNSALTYGLAFTIEKQQVKANKTEWIITNLTDGLAFIEIAAVVEKGHAVNDQINLSTLKEPFSKGLYRIVRVYRTDATAITAFIEFNVSGSKELSDFKSYDTLYTNLSGFKGLELYVWTDSKTSQIQCGLLEGTNREKNEEDFKLVRDNPVSIERMKEILGGYHIDAYIFVLSFEKELTPDMVTLLKSAFDPLKMPNIQYNK